MYIIGIHNDHVRGVRTVKSTDSKVREAAARDYKKINGFDEVYLIAHFAHVKTTAGDMKLSQYVKKFGKKVN